MIFECWARGWASIICTSITAITNKSHNFKWTSKYFNAKLIATDSSGSAYFKYVHGKFLSFPIEVTMDKSIKSITDAGVAISNYIPLINAIINACIYFYVPKLAVVADYTSITQIQFEIY